MPRALGVGGRSYLVARAHDVTVVVTPLEDGFCHVELSADVSQLRSVAVGGSAAGSAALLLVGAATEAMAFGISLPLMIIAFAPLAAGVAAPWLAGRAQRVRNGHIQLAFEQVLDRLERELDVPHRKSTRPNSTHTVISYAL